MQLVTEISYSSTIETFCAGFYETSYLGLLFSSSIACTDEFTSNSLLAYDRSVSMSLLCLP